MPRVEIFRRESSARNTRRLHAKAKTCAGEPSAALGARTSRTPALAQRIEPAAAAAFPSARFGPAGAIGLSTDHGPVNRPSSQRIDSSRDLDAGLQSTPPQRRRADDDAPFRWRRHGPRRRRRRVERLVQTLPRLFRQLHQWVLVDPDTDGHWPVVLHFRRAAQRQGVFAGRRIQQPGRPDQHRRDVRSGLQHLEHHREFPQQQFRRRPQRSHARRPRAGRLHLWAADVSVQSHDQHLVVRGHEAQFRSQRRRNLDQAARRQHLVLRHLCQRLLGHRLRAAVRAGHESMGGNRHGARRAQLRCSRLRAGPGPAVARWTGLSAGSHRQHGLLHSLHQ